LSRTSIIAIDKILAYLSLSQSEAYAYSVVATPLTVRDVVQANDPNYEVTLLGDGYLIASAKPWNDLGEQYSSNKRLQRDAQVVRASRDGFTTTRRGTVFDKNGWMKFWSPPPTSLFVYFYLHRQADTRLISQGNVNASTDPSDLKWEWKAKDTMSFWVHAHYPTLTGWKDSWDEIVPIAGGSAFTSSTASDLDRPGWSGGGWYSGRWFTGDRPNRWSEAYADTNSKNIHPGTPGYHGIRKYWDVRNADKAKNTKVTTSLGIEVRRKPNSPVRTTSNIPGMGSPGAYAKGSSRNGFGSGMFRTDDNFATAAAGAPEVSAVSRAEVFYQRPRKFNDRPDGRVEYSNLFNPYWDVHLVNPKAERSTGWTVRKTVPILP
jgi:hypothetical protein